MDKGNAMTRMPHPLVMGLDFGTDSVRTILIDAVNGAEIAEAVSLYRRWAEGRFCNPIENRYRQHPADHLESLEHAVRKTLKKAPFGSWKRVKGLAVATTGSSPAPVDRSGRPLTLLPAFRNHPDAMFILWKDHTAVDEAAEINVKTHTWGGMDYTRYSGGTYSSEWFWSKILHILRVSPAVGRAAYSWIEHCDWLPGILTGQTDIFKFKRSRCAAGHKAMWHAAFGGLPSEEFLKRLDPHLGGLRSRLYLETHTCDHPAGGLSRKWADRLGLPAGIPVAVGGFDSHIGAVGGNIGPGVLVKVMGTSTCDMLIPDSGFNPKRIVRGICGQVDGSILPGFTGLEAGQSALGDIYAWFRNLLLWPVDRFAPHTALRNKIEKGLLSLLSSVARKSPAETKSPLALDWLNGRRTPFADQTLEGVITGLNLAVDAPAFFRALVESTAFGARRITDCFISQGAAVTAIHAVGGIAKKSPFVMQVHADVLNKPIRVVRADQACALGAAMFAAVGAGLYPDVRKAQQALFRGFERTYQPHPSRRRAYQAAYRRYCALARIMEKKPV